MEIIKTTKEKLVQLINNSPCETSDIINNEIIYPKKLLNNNAISLSFLSPVKIREEISPFLNVMGYIYPFDYIVINSEEISFFSKSVKQIDYCNICCHTYSLSFDLMITSFNLLLDDGVQLLEISLSTDLMNQWMYKNSLSKISCIPWLNEFIQSGKIFNLEKNIGDEFFSYRKQNLEKLGFCKNSSFMEFISIFIQNIIILPKKYQNFILQNDISLLFLELQQSKCPYCQKLEFSQNNKIFILWKEWKIFIKLFSQLFSGLSSKVLIEFFNYLFHFFSFY